MKQDPLESRPASKIPVAIATAVGGLCLAAAMVLAAYAWLAPADPSQQTSPQVAEAVRPASEPRGEGRGADWPSQTPPGPSRTTANKPAVPQNSLDALRAFRYLEQICRFGPRISGSPGMRQQQELLKQHFEQLGGNVSFQHLQAVNPLGGPPVPMANLIVQWHPDRKERILLCAHYDTRPLPDRDPNPVKRRSGIFIGANDGASGVAVLMELAHLMPQFESRVGVDFVLFDGEELVYDDNRDPYFVGSTWFARKYAAEPPQHRYRWGVLLDMVGDADLQIYQEEYSLSWRDTRPLVRQIWATAGRLGVDEFIPRMKYQIRDDHIPLRNIAKIPTCNIIDFDYPHWHTEGDTPQRCSPASLAKVGWVVYEWLSALE